MSTFLNHQEIPRSTWVCGQVAYLLSRCHHTLADSGRLWCFEMGGTRCWSQHNVSAMFDGDKEANLCACPDVYDRVWQSGNKLFFIRSTGRCRTRSIFITLFEQPSLPPTILETLTAAFLPPRSRRMPSPRDGKSRDTLLSRIWWHKIAQQMPWICSGGMGRSHAQHSLANWKMIGQRKPVLRSWHQSYLVL